MRKQTKKPVTKRNKLLMIIAIAAATVVVVGITVVTVNNLQVRRAQVVRLEQASKDLQVLYKELLSKLDVDLSTASFWKRCGQASAKFNSGTITCGSRGKFTQAVAYESAKEGRALEILIRQDSSFIDIKTDEFNSGGSTWSSIDFTHKQSGLKCFADFSGDEDVTEYTLGCNEVVPNFLPGYNRE